MNFHKTIHFPRNVANIIQINHELETSNYGYSESVVEPNALQVITHNWTSYTQSFIKKHM